MESSTNVSGLVSIYEITDDDISESLQGRILLGRHGKPLRLFSKEGKPVTDVDGVPLQSITGRLLLNFNKETSELEDLSGFPLRDCWGCVPSDPEFNPEEATCVDQSVGPIVDKNSNPRVIFDLSGFPLTDNKGRSLTNASGKHLLTCDSKGEPVCNLDGHHIINCSLFDCHRSNGGRILCSSSGQPFRIFDAYKRPLTTIEGFPLLDIMGTPLVTTDSYSTSMKTIYGSDVYDSKGRRKGEQYFDPTWKPSTWRQLPACYDSSGKTLLVFDQTGFPLTEPSGIPLVDSNGKPLFTYDKKRGLVSCCDLEVIQILLSRYNPNIIRSICNEAGKPARLFNFQGKPLTNWLGEPLKHADGSIMLKFAHDGSVKSDFQNLPIYDEYGVSMQESRCMPFEAYPHNGEIPREIDALKNGIRLYDGSGVPTTDHRGFYLTNASRKFMIQRNAKNVPICDSRGGPLFTESGLPLIKSFDKPLLGPKGRVCRLYDCKGFPLTCNKGIPLKLINGEYVIKTDKIGRIVGEYNGGSIYDCTGMPFSFSMKFNPSRSPIKNHQFKKEDLDMLKNKPQLYNITGYPLTDTVGELLTDSSGEALIKIDTVNGCLTDSFGRPVYEPEGRLNNIGGYKITPVEYILCERSDVKYENYYPMEGKNHYNESNEVNMKYQSKGQRKILFNGLYQLFDYESFPILDRSGAILETTNGQLVIKFDVNGQIVSDYRGYDIYDSNGLPVTNVTGFWRDKKGNPLRLFSHSGIPLTDSRGRSLYDINGCSLLGRDEIGRPLLDCNNNIVFDSSGMPSTDYKFCPRKQPHSDVSLSPILDLNEKPLRIYNYNGWPLNDENGMPLVSNKSMPLVDFKLGIESVEDFMGNTVYDRNGIPLGYRQDTPLETMSGKPFRLFNAKGQPLTDYFGTPLKFASELCLIVFDMFGRPIQDSEGEGIYDANGNIIGSHQFRPDMAPSSSKKQIHKADGRPLRLFDHDGRPLTDTNGIILVNASGESLIFIDSGIPLCTGEGGRIYDDYGNEFIPDKNFLMLLNV